MMMMMMIQRSSSLPECGALQNAISAFATLHTYLYSQIYRARGYGGYEGAALVSGHVDGGTGWG